MNLELFAALFTIIAALLSVIFSDGPYTIWDLILGIFVFYVCFSSKHVLATKTPSLCLGSFGIALSLVIVTFSIITLANYDLAEDIRRYFSDFRNGFFDIEFVFAATLSLPIGLYLRARYKNAK